LFFQQVGDGVMVLYGFPSPAALQGSQLAEPVTVVWPVTVPQFPLSEPRVGLPQCHGFAHPCGHLGGKGVGAILRLLGTHVSWGRCFIA